MGYPMAGYLSKNNHDVVVYNRTTARAEAWSEEFEGSVALTPFEAARDADIVFCCVGNDNDVREVLIGERGALQGLSEGAVIVDHTTASAELARELYADCKARSIDFLDAPLSGGQAGAENGQLTIMVGGDQSVFDRVSPIMNCYSKVTTLIGPAGSGQLAKMVNQICIAGVVQGIAEGLHFAKRAGLDQARVIASISKGAAQSWQMENRWETMINNEFEFGFAVDWMRKDLGMTLAEAKRVGATLEMTALVDGYYSEVQELGGNRWDTSSLIARLEK
jgi:3-hydroxyisobutyrate dehydrogenase-like beta-hydroxyacid dehydrogenase